MAGRTSGGRALLIPEHLSRAVRRRIEDRHTHDSDSLVAHVPLAVACLARDCGIPIEVESEYIPEALLEYAWVGELVT
jgi:hypothetical protein